MRTCPEWKAYLENAAQDELFYLDGQLTLAEAMQEMTWQHGPAAGQQPVAVRSLTLDLDRARRLVTEMKRLRLLEANLDRVDDDVWPPRSSYLQARAPVIRRLLVNNRLAAAGKRAFP